VRAERSAAAAGWEGGRRREMTGLTLRGHFRQFFHVGAAACETCGFGVVVYNFGIAAWTSRSGPIRTAQGPGLFRLSQKKKKDGHARQ
jgi:hypothetical protein